MADESFTPTSEHVQRNYVLTEGRINKTPRFAARAEFNNWLNEVKEAVWDECADAFANWTPSGPSGMPIDPPTNPYRAAELRADR